MHILIVTGNFWPEELGISKYSTDLFRLLKASGYEVSVLTTMPYYPKWQIFQNYRKVKSAKFIFEGSSVWRIRQFVPKRASLIGRLVLEASILLNFVMVSRRLRGNEYDKVVSFTPNLACGLAGLLISRTWRIPLGVIVQDLTGLGTKQSGITFGFLVSRIIKRLEITILKNSSSIVAISSTMVDWIKNQGISSTMINCIPNYSVEEIPVLDKNESRSKLMLPPDYKYVIYTGNFGNKQNLENLIQAARLTFYRSDIRFLLFGNGSEEEKLKRLAESLDNLMFLPPVSAELYPDLLSCADILLVHERSTQTVMSLPSKITAYIQSSRPIVAAVPLEGATADFVRDVALLVPAGQPELLSKSIVDLIDNQILQEQLVNKSQLLLRPMVEGKLGRSKLESWVRFL